MSWNGLKVTSYVIHCEKCKRLVKKDERDGMRECPPEKASKWDPRKNAPQLMIGDHRRSENYPQYAPNLPGDGYVTSWDDYEAKCKVAGQEILGSSEESKYRHKTKKKKRTRNYKKPYFDCSVNSKDL